MTRTYWCWFAWTYWGRLAWAYGRRLTSTHWGWLARTHWSGLTRTCRCGLTRAYWSRLAGAYWCGLTRTYWCWLAWAYWCRLARASWSWLASAGWRRLAGAYGRWLARTYWCWLTWTYWCWLASTYRSWLARTYWCWLARTRWSRLAITYWNWRLIWRDLPIKCIWNQTIHSRTCSHWSTWKSSSIAIIYFLQVSCSKGYTGRTPRCLFGECFPCNCKSNSPTWSHSIYRNRLICETTFFVKETFLNSRCLRANLNRNLYFIRTSIWISYYCSQSMPTSRQIRIGSRFPSIGCSSSLSNSCSR